jgi:hypothetical protein
VHARWSSLSTWKIRPDYRLDDAWSLLRHKETFSLNFQRLKTSTWSVSVAGKMMANQGERCQLK